VSEDFFGILGKACRMGAEVGAREVEEFGEKRETEPSTRCYFRDAS